MGKLVVQVCVGLNCSFHGALQLLEAIEEDTVLQAGCDVEEAPCLCDLCEGGTRSPVVRVDGEPVCGLDVARLCDLLHERLGG
ncbi:MAG: hypothetical protein RBU45_13810 [Myxococcota bacterium]|jgi:NADH:ubiquinone oxidoreductase subunit E|nr:hypothetical protein [Myxococcota bacterium]